ncbi:o-succinylbenzoate synthase [Agromyces cerinus]|uniref:o-succinylbenzoate synthase n=1 Tax=Agromyces cerinus TaxID=33878 RepID=UPI001EF76E5C|nr:o-succinylbenzoate synthase [Agromyces cerinus]MBM7832628.1 o-succinylbenzoate synthase [Agromyces cerinus]
MRVTRIELFQVSLPLVHGFQTSSHRKTGLEHILVRFTDDTGATGWGEIASPSDPYFTAENTETAWSIATSYLVPLVIDTEWQHPSEVDALWRKIRGHEFTKAGFAGAAWDLWSMSRGVPLAEALGGTRTEVAAGVSLGIEPTIDELLAQVAAQLDAGYGRVKLKIAPGWDLAPVREVRRAFPDLLMHVDANGAYSSDDDTIERLAGFDAEALSMIEQPFAPGDFVGHARLQERIETPVCLDESVVRLDDLRTMIALGSGRVLNIKVSRMGGLTVAKAAHDLAGGAGIPVWCGGMHEFGIGRAANLALSSLEHFSYPSDVSGSDKYYARDVIVPAVTARDGIVKVPTGPGIGFEVDLAWIEQNLERRFDSDERASPNDTRAGASAAVLFMVDDAAEGGPVVGTPFHRADVDAPQLDVRDLSATRGDGVFETLGVHRGRPQAIEDHLQRFARSAAMLDLPAPKLDVWRDAIHAAIAAHDSPADGFVKFVMTRGVEGAGVPVGWVYLADAADFTVPREQGVAVVTLDRGYRRDVARTSPWLLQGAKSLSYAVNKSVLREAARRGAADVIFTSSDGFVLEGPSSTVLLRFGDRFVSPPSDDGILAGTTLASAIELLAELGHETHREPVRVEQLASADDIWLLSSTRSAVAVAELDGVQRTFDAELTARLQTHLISREH